MKTSKRILSTFMAVIFVLTSFTAPTFAAFTDLDENSNSYTAVNVLNKLGIINGYDDGAGNFSFKPENNVTRAEFTAMLLRTRGMGSLGSTSLENPPFPDVTTSDVSWAIGNIRTARELGIINGYDDGTFKPNNNVSYEEAIKMIVCALGYGDMGAEGTFWYSKYLMTATSLGFLDGAGGAVTTPATRATIAKMLYNCLEVKLAENNVVTEKTILENDLRLTKNVGYIDSNTEISLSAPDSTLRDNEVEITTLNANGVYETFAYKVEDASEYEDMLGAQITFYYTIDKSSNYRHLIMATVKNTEIVEISADMIENYTNTGIEYYRSEDAQRTTIANIGANSVVVYNDKLFGANKATSTFDTYCREQQSRGVDAMPTIGSVKLLDRDGDNEYDVVFIDSYTAWIASSVTSSNKKIVDTVLRKGLPTDQTELVLDVEKSDVSLKIVDAKGKSIAFNSITRGSVISIKESNNGKRVVTAVVSNNTVNGKVSATNTKGGVTINGKEYKFSKQAPWESGAVSTLTGMVAPTYGDSGKFYLDSEGRILAFDKTESTSNQQYGYLNRAVLDTENFDEELTLLIATKSNPNGTRYTVTNKSKLNGAAPSSLTSFEQALQGETVIKFSTKGSNEIDEIITSEPSAANGNDIVDNKLYKYTSVSQSTPLKYDKNSKELGDMIYIENATFIINVENPSKYKIMKITDFQDNVDYNVEFFDVTTTDSAKVVVVHGGRTNIDKLLGSSPVVLIDEVEEGENYVISDVNGNKYVLSSEDSVTNTVAETLAKGDIVRLGGTEGRYTLKPNKTDSSGYVIFSLGINSPTGKFEDQTEGTAVVYQALWGSVYKKYDGERLIVSKTILEGWDGTGTAPTVSPEEVSIPKSGFSNAKIYRIKVNAQDGKTVIEDTTSDGVDNTLEGLRYYDETGTTIPRPAEVFIHMTSLRTVKMMVIVER